MTQNSCSETLQIEIADKKEKLLQTVWKLTFCLRTQRKPLMKTVSPGV